MRKFFVKFSTLLVALALFTGCEVKLPEDIIQPEQMEALLYDYHLAQAMASDVTGGDYKKKLYTDYVFKKHGVTKEQFDSTVVWYNRNPKYLYKIYESLDKRLDAEVAAMGDVKPVGTNIAVDAIVLSGDTVDLWQNDKSTWLSATPLNNRLVFVCEADTTFVEGDSLALSMNVRFASPVKSDARQHAHAALAVEYADSSVAFCGSEITASGRHTLEVPRAFDKRINEVRGFIYYSDNDSLGKARMFMGDISLTRIHPEAPEEEE